MRRSVARIVVVLFALTVLGSPYPVSAAPEGTMTWGVHITLASRWLDPAETEGIITPCMVLYGLHDALVKPMPAGQQTPDRDEAGPQSVGGLLAQGAQRQAARAAQPARGDDACRGAEEGRDRHRLSANGTGGGGHPAHSGLQARRAEGIAGNVLARSARPVGSQITMARQARASGGELRDRPPGAQPGRDAWLQQADGLADPARARVLTLL